MYFNSAVLDIESFKRTSFSLHMLLPSILSKPITAPTFCQHIHYLFNFLILMWGFIEKGCLPVSIYAHVGCIPMQNKFYFCFSLCSCSTSIPASCCLLLSHLLMLSLVTGQTDVLSGEKFLLFEALAAILGRPPTIVNISFHPRCPVLWWTL